MYSERSVVGRTSAMSADAGSAVTYGLSTLINLDLSNVTTTWRTAGASASGLERLNPSSAADAGKTPKVKIEKITSQNCENLGLVCNATSQRRNTWDITTPATLQNYILTPIGEKTDRTGLPAFLGYSIFLPLNIFIDITHDVNSDCG